jgi:hypothetical protein
MIHIHALTHRIVDLQHLHMRRLTYIHTYINTHIHSYIHKHMIHMHALTYRIIDFLHPHMRGLVRFEFEPQRLFLHHSNRLISFCNFTLCVHKLLFKSGFLSIPYLCSYACVCVCKETCMSYTHVYSYTQPLHRTSLCFSAASTVSLASFLAFCSTRGNDCCMRSAREISARSPATKSALRARNRATTRASSMHSGSAWRSICVCFVFVCMCLRSMCDVCVCLLMYAFVYVNVFTCVYVSVCK